MQPIELSMYDNFDDQIHLHRGKARLNSTVAALLSRGFASDLANKLKADTHSLSSLKQMSDDALSALGLTQENIVTVRKDGRAAIPFGNLARVLWANRSTCCVCRRYSLAIIVHHISPWATSHDHATDNLAVLCLEHHAQAHRRGDLEQNLGMRPLKAAKEQWEAEVATLDAKAILDASRMHGHHWWWFNHQRLFEIAERGAIKLRQQPGFEAARATGLVDREGHLTSINDGAHYRYDGGGGNYLYRYVRNVFEAVLVRTSLFNVSDDLDPGMLSQVVSEGDLILVQGKHLFKQLTTKLEGPSQSSEVRREVNGIRISFTIDRWEAVSNSAWCCWLTRSPPAASILRVASVEREANKLHLRCTGIAIGATLRGLTTRSYVNPTWPAPLIDDDDDFLSGFGE